MQVWNRNFFTTSENVEFSWALSSDGVVQDSGPLSIPTLSPGMKHHFPLKEGPWSLQWEKCYSSDQFLVLTAKLCRPTRWADAGHVLASQQFNLPILKPLKQEVILIYMP